MQLSSRPAPFKPPKAQVIKSTIDRLTSFYQQYSFYKHIPIEYLCGLASRYAAWTMPRFLHTDSIALESYSLWLSLIWIVDGMLDSGKVERKEDITDIFFPSPVTDKQQFATAFHDDSPRDSDNPFQEIVRAALKRYRYLIRPYRNKSPDAYQMVEHWLRQYFTVQNNKPNSISDYKRHRLADGGMMCVLWQLVMYMQITNFSDEKIFTHVSLIVSYHNDLLSYNRDMRQKTPNIINFSPGDSVWERYTNAVNIIDLLYDKIKHTTITPQITSVCSHVLLGSHNWCLGEDRYKVGVSLLRQWEANDRQNFNLTLTQSDHAAGDPTTK